MKSAVKQLSGESRYKNADSNYVIIRPLMAEH